jgi:hypothetical protein
LCSQTADYDYVDADPINKTDLGGDSVHRRHVRTIRRAARASYGYHFSYLLGLFTFSTADQVFNRIKNHMAWFFPIPGMCNSLSVGRTCSLAGNPVQIEQVGSRHFQLRSLPGHIEGADKHINFTIRQGGWGAMYLDVTAWGPANTFCSRNVVCAAFNANIIASGLWSMFATNISFVTW